MTDETKKLFDAPWEWGEEPDCLWVVDSNGETICAFWEVYGEENHKSLRKTVNRLARLPELYDALWESILLINRLIGAWEEGIVFGEFCDQYLKDYDNVQADSRSSGRNSWRK